MRQLLEFQPENIEPVEFTHFDMWFAEDDLTWMEHASLNDIKEQALIVLNGWTETLGVKFDHCPASLLNYLELEAFFDLVIIRLLEYGFDVYKGSTFIEIYKGE